jgi:hypothetical protein
MTKKAAEETKIPLRFPFKFTDTQDTISMVVNFSLPQNIQTVSQLVEYTKNHSSLSLHCSAVDIKNHYRNSLNFLPNNYHLMPLMVRLERADTRNINHRMHFRLVSYEANPPTASRATKVPQYWTDPSGIYSSAVNGDAVGYPLPGDIQETIQPLSQVVWTADSFIARTTLQKWKCFDVYEMSKTMQSYISGCGCYYDIPTGGRSVEQVDNCLSHLMICAMPHILYNMSIMQTENEYNDYSFETAVTSEQEGSAIKVPVGVANAIIDEVINTQRGLKDCMCLDQGLTLEINSLDPNGWNALRMHVESMQRSAYPVHEWDKKINLNIMLAIDAIPCHAYPTGVSGVIPAVIGQLPTYRKDHAVARVRTLRQVRLPSSNVT